MNSNFALDQFMKSMLTGTNLNISERKEKTSMAIKNVIFNDPATIVLWEDGTKTVVKAYNEAFDPEKGLVMAIAKKALGNKGNYYNQIRKWIDTFYENIGF